MKTLPLILGYTLTVRLPEIIIFLLGVLILGITIHYFWTSRKTMRIEPVPDEGDQDAGRGGPAVCGRAGQPECARSRRERVPPWDAAPLPNARERAEALPLGASFLRAIAFWAALGFTFGIGHIVGGLRKDKRAFHDLLAGSRAERLPPPAPSRRMAVRRQAPPSVAASPVPAAPFQPPPESEPRSIG